jgi:thioesterase domain-containing protein
MSLRYGGSTAPESAPAKTAYLTAGRSRDAHPAVIALQPEGSRPPLFCVDAGSLWLPLSSRLDGDRPVLGLRVPVSEAGRFPVPFRIEDGAGELVHYLREIQTSGPYYLAGLCIDGLVAYEMARQLVAQGQEVALLALLDVPSPRKVPLAESGARIPPGKIYTLWTELLQGGIHGAPGFVHRRGKAIARRLKLLRWSVQQSLGLKLNVNKLLNDPDVVEEPNSYFSKPRPYAGPVLFFQSDDCQSPDPAWYNLISGGWKVHRVRGGHLSMFHEENVGTLADKLRACLSDYLETETTSKQEKSN